MLSRSFQPPPLTVALTPEQRKELLATASELLAWVNHYRKTITPKLYRPPPQPDTLALMDEALRKSRQLNAVWWLLFIDTNKHPNP